MAESKKVKNGEGVFDVAKPGKSAPSSSAKPIIVTNRPVLKDPMVVEDEPSEAVAGENLPATTQAALAPPSTSKIKIEPLHLDASAAKEASKEDEASKPSDTTKASETEEDAKPSDDFASNDADSKIDDSSTGSTKSKKTSEDEEVEARKVAERAEQLDQLAVSRKYYLPINQVEKRRAKHMVALGAVFIVLLGLAWVDVALDAGIISIPGIKAPTHFFKTDATVQASAPVVTPKAKSTTPTSDTSQELAKANAESIRTNLEAYFANNNAYPSTLAATNLPGIDPSALTAPTGVKFGYTVTPTGCTTAAKTCQHYTLKVTDIASNTNILTLQSVN